jgi:hypothetical protein
MQVKSAWYVRLLKKLGYSGKLSQLPMSTEDIVLTPEQEKASCEGDLKSAS